MSQSGSKKDLQIPSLQSSSGALKSSSKPKMNRDQGHQAQNVRIIASLQNITQVHIRSPNSMQCHSDTCHIEPPVKDPFSTRYYNGKVVRDVLIDTHDLINEPGGFVINLTHHGQGSDSKEMRIHLGIKEKRSSSPNQPSTGVVRPGTITTTDDYARDIFRAIRTSPQLELLTAILEINDDDDRYEQKVFPEMSPVFLQKLIQTYPMMLTKFHVEMPGVSPVYLPEWKFLMDQQVSLKFLTCNFGVVLWNFYQNTVIRNSKTLERVILRRLQTYDMANARYFPFNWRIFSECANLKYLKVTCGYKSNVDLKPPHPPSSVFLHENLEDLPKADDIFEELHLRNIWIDPCVFESFCNARPNLKICRTCNDLEYYDGDKADACQMVCGSLQLISVSVFDLRAQFSPTSSLTGIKVKTPQRSREKQLACLVLALFHVILMALAILFIIIYFRHLRSGKPNGNKII